MKTRIFQKWAAFLLTAAMLLTANGVSSVQVSAAKAPKLSSKTVTLKVGASKKLTVKNKPAKAKLTWSSKNKKIAKVNRGGKITAVKKGNTSVICKVAYKKGKKKVTKKLTASVKVKAASKSKATPEATAAATTQAVAASPAAAAVPGGQAPSAPETPAEEPSQAPTAEPTETPTKRPVIVVTKTPDEFSNVGEEHTTDSGLTSKDNGKMRKELSTLDMISNMSLGWNLGNQMEQSNFKGTMTTIDQCETSAGNPKATQQTFDGLKSYGINTVRIPVAWSNFMSTDGNYTISPKLLDRVEEIVNYALNDEMYVIINEHWDGGWWGMFGSPDETVREEAWKKYKAIWTQISERFKGYSDHLIFEGGNEELSSAFPTTENWGLNTKIGADGFLDATGPAGTLSEDEIYETAAEISQEFVNIVRKSGGNNAYRHLLIPGNTTAIDKATDERFKMPKDTEENGNTKLSVSVHIYEPQGYALTASSSDEGYRSSWGTDEDKKELRTLLEKVKKFTDQGYGVIAGECGVVKADKDNIVDWMQYYFSLCNELHIAPVWWDEGHYFNREAGYFNYEDVGELFAEWTASTPKIPKDAQLQKTGVCVVPTVENKDPKVVYTWEGEFMRHTNKDTGLKLVEERGDDITFFEEYGEAGIGRTDSMTDGMEAVINEEFWNISVTCDWSKIEKPCVRVYPMDNIVSQGADLQLAYCEAAGKTTKKAADYTGNWVGEYIELDKEMIFGRYEENKKTGETELKTYPWLWITTNTYTGASYVKIEICDAAYNADGTKAE